MAGLRLGPLLRYVDGTTRDRLGRGRPPCDGRGPLRGRRRRQRPHLPDRRPPLRADPGRPASTPGTDDRVRGAARRRAGLAAARTPPSRPARSAPRAPDASDRLRVAFGSCRWAAPPAAGAHDPVGPDALDTLAAQLAADRRTANAPTCCSCWATRCTRTRPPSADPALARRPPRPVASRPGEQVADYEEYTQLYDESWLDPEVRWLLSTVPSCMIFDDHDVIDDWNTSAAWLRRHARHAAGGASGSSAA